MAVSSTTNKQPKLPELYALEIPCFYPLACRREKVAWDLFFVKSERFLWDNSEKFSELSHKILKTWY